MEKFLFIYVCVFANTLYADTITDVWDINQGASVLSSSGEGASSLANMFGGTFSSPESGIAFFRDDRAAGFTHFVEWQSAEVITLTGYHLSAYDDNAINEGDRGFTAFRLFAFDTGISSFQLVDTFIPASNPYPGNTIDIARTLAPVTAQIFRAEFDQFAAGSFPGPRVRELDAIITTVPVPAAVWLFASGLIGLVGIRRR